ncbi:alpha/beta fold hydrolase [Methylobacterium sp. J-088]|uniref:alpha/beta fold hydrolase n=1 Tax=Methylobacterium sp. J-088 TaxID=2836664 RepID=UPI0039192450
MEGLVAHLGIERYTLFVQDYGGPVGFRMALAHPERVSALIVQNANAYVEGLGPKWQGIARFWADPASHPEQVDAFTSLEGAKRRQPQPRTLQPGHLG